MDQKRVRKVLKEFGIREGKVHLISQKNKRSVWKVTQNDHEYVLKSLRLKKKFLPYLHEYMIKKGVPLVPTLPSRKGQLYVRDKENCFILFPWIKGDKPGYDELDMIERISSLLAEYHEASRGYAATGRPVANKLHFWEKHYQQAYKQFVELKKFAKNENAPFSKMLLSHVPWIESRIEWVLQRFPQSPYYSLVDKAGRDPLLQHGDYGNHNLILNKQGELILIDLDTAAIALPMWDVSRLITLINHDLQGWSSERFNALLKGYQTVRSINKQEMELLLIDQVFPHHSISIALLYYQGGDQSTLLEELERSFTTDHYKLCEFNIGPKRN